MRRPHSFALAALCLLWLSGCAATGGDEETAVYVVRAQDTLYSIAWRNDLDYRDLAKWNGLGPDFRITVGERLLLKPRTVTAASGNASRSAGGNAGGNASGNAGGSAGGNASGSAGGAALNAAASAARRASTDAASPLHAAPSDAAGVARVDRPQPLPDVVSAPAVSPARVPTASTPTAGAPMTSGATGSATPPPLAWVWPTDRTAAPRAVAGGGILLSGRLGQPIRSAAAGRVVYAGSGLRGYGKLIIIKHADALLSAYAHNQQLLVHEGQDVSVGQTIAVMGEGAPNKPVLYFEIRANGRPTDPIPYLTGKK